MGFHIYELEVRESYDAVCYAFRNPLLALIHGPSVLCHLWSRNLAIDNNTTVGVQCLTRDHAAIGAG